MTVLVLGSLHWDTVVDAPRLPGMDETVMGTGVAARFGGKGGLQAVAAARAGAAVEMRGAVGDDAAGRAMLAHLDGCGVGRGGVRVVDAPSGMSVAIAAGGEYGAVVVTGANALARGGAPDGATTILMQNEVPAAANAALARAKGAARVILNAAPARDCAALAGLVDLWVVNRVEAEQMGPLPGVVVETRGSGGVVVRDGAVERRFAAERVEAVSSHGAGDAFCGTLAARLDAGDGLDDAVAAGQRAAAAVVAGPR